MKKSIIMVFNSLYKSENVFVIIVKSINYGSYFMYTCITMQSYNFKSNEAGKQHFYHSICTPPHAPLVLCIVIKYIIMALITLHTLGLTKFRTQKFKKPVG